MTKRLFVCNNIFVYYTVLSSDAFIVKRVERGCRDSCVVAGVRKFRWRFSKNVLLSIVHRWDVIHTLQPHVMIFSGIAALGWTNRPCLLCRSNETCYRIRRIFRTFILLTITGLVSTDVLRCYSCPIHFRCRNQKLVLNLDGLQIKLFSETELKNRLMTDEKK